MEPAAPRVPQKNELTKKQELNNHIVRMRKCVRQARVHVINKLTKEVKRLRDRKGPENIQLKARRKSERYLEEIKVLKHLKPDKVSVYALQDQNTLEQSLQAKDSTTESRALARLSHHPIIQTQVTKYRDQNPHWILQIPVLLEKSKEKQKLTQKKAEKKEKAKEVVKAEVETNPDADLDSDTDSHTGPVESEESQKPVRKVPEKNKPEKVAKKLPIPVTKLGKEEGTVKIQILKDLTDLEEPASKKSKSEAPSPREERAIKRPKSSFFIGGVDDPVVKDKLDQQNKAFKPSNSEPQQPPKPLFRKGKLIKPLNRAGRREQIYGKPTRSFDKPTNFGNNSNPNRIPITRKPSERLQKVEPTPTAPAEKLHPSWEAKKKSQVSLAAFKGKKITFGDD